MTLSRHPSITSCPSPTSASPVRHIVAQRVRRLGRRRVAYRPLLSFGCSINVANARRAALCCAGAARRPGETTERCSRRAAAAQRDPPQPAGWNRTVLPEPGFGATGDVHPEGSQHIHHPAGIVGGDYWPHNPIQVNNERHVLARPAEVETEPVDQIAAAIDPPSAQRPLGNPAHLADGGVRYALRAGREVVVADDKFAVGTGHRAVFIAHHAHQRNGATLRPEQRSDPLYPALCGDQRSDYCPPAA